MTHEVTMSRSPVTMPGMTPARNKPPIEMPSWLPTITSGTLGGRIPPMTAAEAAIEAANDAG